LAQIPATKLLNAQAFAATMLDNFVPFTKLAFDAFPTESGAHFSMVVDLKPQVARE
jgi:hypothetical protein